MENQDKKYLDKIRKLLVKAKDSACSENEVEIFMAKAQELMLRYNLEVGDIELHPSDINKDIVFYKLRKIFKYKHENFEWELIDSIAQFYNCKIFRGYHYDFDSEDWKKSKKIRLSIVGTNDNRTIVKEMYETLVHKFLTLSEIRWKEWSQETKKGFIRELEMAGLDTKGMDIKYLESIGRMDIKRTWVSSYLIGCIKGLKNKLQKEQELALALLANKNTWGLIVIKHDELIKVQIPKLMGKVNYGKISNKSNFNSDVYNEGIEDGGSNQNNKYIQ